MTKREPRKLEGILESLLKEIEKKKRWNLNRAEIFRLLEEKILKGISHHIKFGEIKRGKVTMMVDNPVWCYELRFKKDLIKSVLNEYLGKEKIKEVRVRVQ